MTTLKTSRRGRVLFAAAAILALGLGAAEARPGGGGSFGSRGSRTFSAPPATTTAPRTAAPIERSITQPGQPSFGQQATGATRPGGFFRPGFGTGLLGGLLGAGLLGALFGHGFFGGLGGIMSFLGLLLQLALVFFVVRFAINWFRSRNAPAAAGAGAGDAGYQRSALGGGMGGLGGSGMGFGGGQPQPAPAGTPIEIGPQDYAAFEKLLGDVNAAWDAENEGLLRRYTTPEMASYFGQELADNARKGLHDRVKEVKLLQGDLAEAWREGSADYATVAMRFSVVNALFERASGRVVEGDPTRPQEVTEIWTFRRDPGDSWKLSAIQQQG
ncbi:hypothetical protein SLNSH_04070 [Alsobacter soli]|uniref:Tim44-like domain-containing protein n=1 Tax=Alsobacter soli TaxID=2109933 RepID=A0A2T1HXN5_9HYPH|nr:TIM44-like domain-containing protein [Alsobacter soli]PSC06463.1 hypothetical protein SLNSH_04070 [Alsobacter soli]